MRHPNRMRTARRLLGAAIAASSLTLAMAAGHPAARTPAPSPPPPPVAPHTSAPAPHHRSDPGPRSASVEAASTPRHRSGREVVVFGDPFWDPLWDIDADLALGYTPYAYPPPSWVYGPTGRARRNLVPIELHVHPWKASVIVDESTLGQARDYNDGSHPLFLTPGSHLVELQYPGYETLRFDLDVQKGLPRDLHYTLIKGEGVDPRSAEAPAAAAGRNRS